MGEFKILASAANAASKAEKALVLESVAVSSESCLQEVRIATLLTNKSLKPSEIIVE